MSAGTGASAASLLPVRTEVAGARRYRGIAARGGSRPEVFVTRELLREQLGTDDLAVAHEQAAIGLVVEGDLRDTGDRQRVQDAGDDREHDRQQNGLNE